MKGVKFIKEREFAIRLRKKGLSIRVIEKKLAIKRSTLSSWFKAVELTKDQKDKLRRQWEEGFVKARKKAALWHRAQKNKRLVEAEKQADEVLSNLNLSDRNILDLALAFLYLGEGYKSIAETGLGNSDPMVLKVFIYILRKNYHIETEAIRAELYLRADQDPDEIKKFWSRELNLPLENFKYVSLDKRTKGSKTFPNYKGVCSIRCSNVAIQRKLLNISKRFAEELLKRV